MGGLVSGRLAGWALPVLAGLLLAPVAARADCGDYVVTRLSRAGTLPAAEHAVPRPHKPCSGPHCSQAPVAPPAPVPANPLPTYPEWGCAFDGLLIAPPDATALLPGQRASRPVPLPSDIFHPPRLSS